MEVHQQPGLPQPWYLNANDNTCFRDLREGDTVFTCASVTWTHSSDVFIVM